MRKSKKEAPTKEPYKEVITPKEYLNLTDEEKKRIEKAQEAYRSAEGLVDKYAAKLRSAQEETQKSARTTKPSGTFYARAASALRGNQMELRRTQAAEETVRQVKKTNQLLKDMDGGGSMTFS